MKVKLTSLPASLSGKYVFLDTETVGLYGKIRLVQMYVCEPHKERGDLFLIDCFTTPVVKVISLLYEAEKLIGHNLLYDFHCLKQCGFNVDEVNFDDTFLLSRLSKPMWEKYGLDRCLQNVLGIDIYAKYLGEDAKKRLQRSKWDGELLDEQLLYAALDVVYLPELYSKISHASKMISYELDKRTVVNFVKMAGKLPVDVEAMTESKRSYETQILEMNVPINVNSFKQVREYLDSDESDDDALARLSADTSVPERAARAKNVRQTRKLRKLISFIDSYLPRIDDDGYIHGHLNLSPITGRSGCDEVNLQQIPSTLKSLFKSKDKFLIYADFSNLELRTFAAVVGDETMATLLKSGVDMHRYVAAFLFEKSEDEVTKKERKIAKTFNFSSLYGANWVKKQAILLKQTGIYLPDDEMEKLHLRWFQLFPTVWRWHRESAKKQRAGMFTSTPLGREVFANRLNMWLNVPIQGAGAEIAKLALNYMLKHIDPEKFLLFVHDSYTLESATERDAIEIAKHVAHAMAAAWREYMPLCAIQDIPMPIDVDIAPPNVSWAELQEGENICGRVTATGLIGSKIELKKEV